MMNMIIECCSQERSYSSFYGLIGERFSKLNRVWTECAEHAFGNYYSTIHRYETNRLRNIARFFGHMIASDAVSWSVLSSVRLTEDDTTSSSRIFLKIVLQEVMETMGLKGMKERFDDPEVREACKGLFPMENPKETRFAINYLTSVGLGAITERMREHLKVGSEPCFLFCQGADTRFIERAAHYHGAAPCNARSRVVLLRLRLVRFLGFRHLVRLRLGLGERLGRRPPSPAPSVRQPTAKKAEGRQPRPPRRAGTEPDPASSRRRRRQGCWWQGHRRQGCWEGGATAREPPA